MRCTPKYVLDEREDVGSRECNKTCFHWENCVKENEKDLQAIMDRKETEEE